MYILGISAFYHDSAACIIKDGEIIAAAQQERFSRKKHDESFPKLAIDYCLKEAKIKASELSYVAFYDKPLLKFERILETQLAFAPKGYQTFVKSIPIWLKEKMWIKDIIRKEVPFKGKVLFPEHHLSHAASAFYPSPFQHAAFLTLDGVGEWTTTSWGIGSGNSLKIAADIAFPHSIGLLYSAFTYYLGFKVNSGEYKVMGLAAYGKPKYTKKIYDHLIDVKEDGSYRLNMDYFNFAAGLTMTNERFAQLFGLPNRTAETLLTQKHMDIARSVQEVLDDIMLRMGRHIHKETRQKYLCLAGGVALNCVANGKLLRQGPFENIWIQPAAGDAGGSLGAALLAWYQFLGNKRKADRYDSMQGAYLGPAFSDEQIEAFLKRQKASYQKLSKARLTKTVASHLANHKVVGWFQGRMEFGPRALGSRSILGDARSKDMQKNMNLKIKFRESFRPFAPAVLEEKAKEYFDINMASPYMLLVADIVKKRQKPMTPKQKELFGIDKLNVNRSDIPAVTHVDYSARLQTVDKVRNPLFYTLIEEFYKQTGYAVIINTSFNVRGEPIVCTPQQAYTCFMRTNIDYLALGHYLLDKKEQPALAKDIDWQKEFELD